MHRPPETAQSRPLRPPSGAYGARTSVSSPLGDLQIYRPGATLALAILALPVAVTLAVAEVALQLQHAVPVWLPFLALLWLPAAPLVWLLMQSARTTTTSIAIARPWRTWMELRWDEIERVEQRGMLLRISGQSETLVFAPRLLREGARLRRQILLRLPPHVLSVRLSREAEDIVSSNISMSADGSIAGSLVARPQARYTLVLLLAACALGVAAGLVVWRAATPPVIAAAGVVVLLALGCLAGANWLAQRLSLDDRGITITHALALPRRRFFAWDRITMVEYTPRQALLRIRDSHARALCAGPRLLDSEQATILWALIQSHCHERDVLIIPRRRLPS